ncbi:MAG: hypothetical protein A2231_05500 [Candidatus Firestonebacteria bacterium RIFOXYA2_FULL_40_8]|nr:MAG: hypothetical protein A2231_05500 [Candidatus Firestonebacteria bacterium RIFOXYA2_FULL_40_8]
MDKVRFGIIGCGDIAEAEIKGMEVSGNSEIKCVMDVNPEYAKRLGEKHKIDFTSDLKEMLKRKDIDAVVVCVPHFLHKAMGLEVIKAGKHLVMEKPLATNRKDALELADAAKKAGVQLSVAYILRFQESVEKTKALIASGAIGKVINITMQNMSYKPESYWTQGWSKVVKSDWRTSKEKSGGGVLIMNVSHVIDLMYYITGLKAKSVYAEYDTFATKVEVEDMIIANLRYDNGAIGLIQTSSTAHGAGEMQNRIYGTEGQLNIGLIGEACKLYTTKDIAGIEKSKWVDIPFTPLSDMWGGPRANYFKEFSGAVLNKQEVPVPAKEAMVSFDTCLAAYRSGEEKKPVIL